MKAETAETARASEGDLQERTRVQELEGAARTKLRRERRTAVLLYSGLILQAVSAFVFIGELWSEILGLRTTPIPFAYQELIQVLASAGLLIGVIAGALLLRRSHQRMEQLHRQVDVAAGNYEDHLRTMFGEWQLSPSEQAVAVYAMKGFSNGEIAELRNTSASTVKSQMNAIYRKTGLQNRQQLISFLVEDLLAGITVETSLPAQGSARTRARSSDT